MYDVASPDRRLIVGTANLWDEWGATLLLCSRGGEGKAPIAKRWQRTKYEENARTIAALQRGDYNLGALCGAHRFGNPDEPTLVNIDFDSAELAELFEERFPELFRETRVERSGGKGLPHLFMWVDARPANCLFDFGEKHGGEIRANELNIILYPSVHRTSGRSYGIVNDRPPSVMSDLKDVVAWLKPTPSAAPLEKSPGAGSNELATAIKARFPTALAVFDHLGYLGDREPQANGEIKIRSNQGLFCNGWRWYQFGSEVGGDQIDAAAFCLLGRSLDRRNPTEFLAIARRLVPEAMDRNPAKATVVSSTRAAIQYFKSEPMDQLFGAIDNALQSTGQFFAHGESLVLVLPGKGMIPATVRTFTGVFDGFIDLSWFPAKSKTPVFGPLDRRLVETYLNNPARLDGFPRLRHYTRMPCFDIDGQFVGTPGFHEASGIYYDGPVIEPADDSVLLEQLLEGFHWRSSADRANTIGAILTGITMPQWIGKHPLVVIDGNQPGVGKSTLARLCGALITGNEIQPIGYTRNEEEFEKQLATLVDAGCGFVVIDNAKKGKAKEVQSATLERLVTSPVLQFRRLGSNSAADAIVRPNNVQFCLTMNDVTLGTDLRRRALTIRLKYEGNPHGMRFAGPDPVEFALQHHAELMAELAGIVLRGQSCSEEIAPVVAHSICQAWAVAMSRMLAAAGVEGFLANQEEADSAADSDFDLLCEVCEEHHNASPAPAAVWVDRVEGMGIAERFRDGHGNTRSIRSQSTTIGQLLTRYVGRRFVVEGETWILNRAQDGSKINYWFDNATGRNSCEN